MTTDDKKCGLTCPLTGCSVMQVLIAMLVAFAFTMGFDWVYHGIYMKPDYEATADMWRPEEAMEQFFHICLIYHAVLAFAVAGLYCWISKSAACGGKCHKTGLRFGFFIGLMLGISHFASYIWMPIPMEMALKWLAGNVLWGVLLGLLLSLLCRACCKKSCHKDAK